MRHKGLWLAMGGTLAAVLVALVIRSGLLDLLAGVPPAAQGELRVRSLDSEIRLVRDSLGVPHVFARTRDDAFLGLGFVHAQDRLWQMELLRRSARGTLSEIFGRTTLAADRLARTLGLARAARAETNRLRPSARRVLDAYARGVNAYLEQLRHDRRSGAAELRWLGIEPEPWTPADTLAIVRLRAWMLGRSLRASLLLGKLVRELGGVASQDFFPIRPLENSPELLGSLIRLGRVADLWAACSGLGGRAGSLGFLVGGGRSKSGQPILANDPHAGFQLPALFYVAHLHFGDHDLSGGTWPGVPVFWSGTSGEIAWGQVALHASVSDLFEETLDPDDPHRYDYRGRWFDVMRRTESIPVKGESAEKIEILETHNGPLLGTVFPRDPVARNLSLRWTGLGPRSGIEALLAIPGVRDWKVFQNTLRRYPAPAATFLYADRKGRIGTQVAGHLPIRAIETGLLPLPGRSRYYDWRGFIPLKELPHRMGTDIPWLVVSPHPRDFSSPYGVAWLWKSDAVDEELAKQLQAVAKLGDREVSRIQRDRHSAHGPAWIRRRLRGVQAHKVQAARVEKLLLEWDGSSGIDSIGASVYHIFRQRLVRRLLLERVSPQIAHELERLTEPLPGLVSQRFLDRVSREGDIGPLLEQALEETGAILAVQVSSNPQKWVWGDVHRLRLPHAFERFGHGTLAWLGWRLGRGPFPAPGSPDSVWTMYHARLPTTHIEVGPSFRYSIDLADPDHASFGLAGGESGHSGSPHYDDLLAFWLKGRPQRLWMHPADIEVQTDGEWDLLPGGE